MIKIQVLLLTSQFDFGHDHDLVFDDAAMGKAGRGLFQDEPEEPQKRLRRAPNLFGAEPEESSSRNLKTTGSVRPVPVLFGDEGDELNPSAPEVDTDDEGAPPPKPTLNLDWSALKLFDHATFLQKSVNESKVQPQKRTYDNSKRAEQAASSLKHKATSFKESALKSGRIEDLIRKHQCNWILFLNLEPYTFFTITSTVGNMGSHTVSKN